MLNSIAIANFKCFSTTERIKFSDSINIIIGKNNSGKSSFLSALSIIHFPNSRYRGLGLASGTPLNPYSRVDFEVTIPGTDLQRILLSSGWTFYWQWDGNQNPMTQETKERWDKKLNILMSRGHLRVRGYHLAGRKFSIETVTTDEDERIFPGRLNIVFSPNQDKQDFRITEERSGPDETHFVNAIQSYLNQSIYIFRAERLHIGHAQVSNNSVLSPDANNLAQVINKPRG